MIPINEAAQGEMSPAPVSLQAYYTVTFKHRHETPGGMTEEWAITANGYDVQEVAQDIKRVHEILLNG